MVGRGFEVWQEAGSHVGEPHIWELLSVGFLVGPSGFLGPGGESLV